jgi:hypothetical protein
MSRQELLAAHLRAAIEAHYTITQKTAHTMLGRLLFAAKHDYDRDALDLYARIARDICGDIDRGARLNQGCNGWIPHELNKRLERLEREWGPL